MAHSVDYCSLLYAGLPGIRLGCLDRVMRSAARLIGHISKYEPVSGYMLTVLHWLPPEQRITYRLAALIWRCLLGLAPVYLRELCCTTLSAGGSRSLRSSEQGLLQVPFARTSIRQNRAFSVLGPSTWNGLPLELRLLPRSIPSVFLSSLKTVLFRRAGVGSASE